MQFNIDDEDLEADLKLRDSCTYMEDGEVLSLSLLSVMSFVSAIVLIWWYTGGATAADRKAPN